jgi:hypothetical protein
MLNPDKNFRIINYFLFSLKVGATASASYPYQFYWQDGTPVSTSSFCSGHPKGGNNLCGFYTTKAVIGRDRCISTGPCSGTFFDHGAICHYGANFGGSSTPYYTTTRWIGK